MVKCGITGSTGVLGSEIQRILNFKFNSFKGDITKKKDLKKWILKNEFDLIIHLAAIVPTNEVKKNYRKAYLVNYFGTKNLIDLILKYKKNLKWFFFASTSHVYSYPKKNVNIKENYKKNPISKYGKTKLKAERYVESKLKKNIPYCIGRIFSFTHPAQKNSFVVPSIFDKINKTKEDKILFKNLNHYRDFISTRDISLIIKWLWVLKSKGIYNLARGKKTNLQNIPLKISKILNKKIKFRFVNSSKTSFLIANINKIKKIGWTPKDNLSDILKSFKN